MSRKPSLIAVNLIILGLFVVMGFNNCQPMSALPSGEITQGSGGGGGGGSNMSAGQQYFEATLKPMFMNRCNSCHALPFQVQPPNVAGPLSIFTYSTMRSMIMIGPSSVNNPLFNIVTNVTAHTGGTQCFLDVNGSVSPCREIKTWTTLEFPLLADGMAGAVVNVTPTGQIRGWALNPRSPANQIQVFIYAGAVDAGGVLVGQVLANGPGDGQQQNGHYFTYQLPPAYANGVSRQYYLYGVQATAENELPGNPRAIAAYTPRQAGRTYFENTVRPQLQACIRCHGDLDYETRYAALISPLPANGGTANNNELVTKMSGGMNHGGGNLCGGGDAGRCAAVRQWWALEFN